MKKIENSFVVSGFVGKDASIHQFSTASVARFSLAVSLHECRGIFVFWALFFLTEPYKFALYPTFSLLLCNYFKNIA